MAEIVWSAVTTELFMRYLMKINRHSYDTSPIKVTQEQSGDEKASEEKEEVKPTLIPKTLCLHLPGRKSLLPKQFP